MTRLPIHLFGAELKRHGFNFYSGVPCSHLKSVINYAINECRYIMAANEGDAVAICAGAHLGGEKTVFLCQNSGLTNAISPLTSLNDTFKIPVLGFVSLRGEKGIADEPQHELMGQVTTQILELMHIKWAMLATEFAEARGQLATANSHIENNRSFFFVVRKGTFEEEPLSHVSLDRTVNITCMGRSRSDGMPTRLAVLETLNALKDHATAAIATTGMTGRELYEVEDAPHYFYMVGSMGCVSSVALGLALAQTGKQVIAIDGDGALLMRMGALATNAYYHPDNMLHVLLDNNSHDSTGGQSTVSHNVDFVSLAASVGYAHAIYVHDLDELEHRVRHWKKTLGLTFLYMRIAKGSKEGLGRPKVKPYEVKDRLMRFVRKGEGDCD